MENRSVYLWNQNDSVEEMMERLKKIGSAVLIVHYARREDGRVARVVDAPTEVPKRFLVFVNVECEGLFTPPEGARDCYLGTTDDQDGAFVLGRSWCEAIADNALPGVEGIERLVWMGVQVLDTVTGAWSCEASDLTDNRETNWQPYIPRPEFLYRFIDA